MNDSRSTITAMLTIVISPEANVALITAAFGIGVLPPTPYLAEVTAGGDLTIMEPDVALLESNADGSD